MNLDLRESKFAISSGLVVLAAILKISDVSVGVTALFSNCNVIRSKLQQNQLCHNLRKGR